MAGRLSSNRDSCRATRSTTCLSRQRHGVSTTLSAKRMSSGSVLGEREMASQKSFSDDVWDASLKEDDAAAGKIRGGITDEFLGRGIEIYFFLPSMTAQFTPVSRAKHIDVRSCFCQ